MAAKQLKNLAFFYFLFSENGAFSGLKVKISKNCMKYILTFKLFALYIIIVIEIMVKRVCTRTIEFFKIRATCPQFCLYLKTGIIENDQYVYLKVKISKNFIK